MSLTQSEITCVVDELKNTLQSSILQKISHAGETGFIFQFHKQGQSSKLLIDLESGYSRLHLIQFDYEKREVPTAFCMLLRKYLLGRKCIEIEQAPHDRFVKFIFDSDRVPNFIFCELFGNKNTIFLTNDVLKLVGVFSPQKTNWKIHDLYQPPLEQTKYKSSISRFRNSNEIETFYLEKIKKDREIKQKNRFILQIQKNREKNNRLIQKMKGDLVKFQKSPDYQLWGECLKANFYSMKPKMEKIDVINYMDIKQTTITIPLDPKLSPEKNMESYFTKSKRLKRGMTEILNRLERLKKYQSELDRKLYNVENTPVSIQSTFVKESKSQKSQPRKFRSQTRHIIWIGRTAKQNEELTFERAKSDDIWLHISQHRGPHAIVELNKGEEIRKETLIEAAILLLYYSGFKRDGDKEEIIYTQRKFVRRLKGGHVGQVTCQNTKSIIVKMDLKHIEVLKGLVK